MILSKIKEFREVLPDGTLKLNLHSAQSRVWDSIARFVFMIAGTQSGKTVLGPHWLEREIAQHGEGDYLAVTPTFPLLDKKMLPEFIYVFDELFHLGKYNRASNLFQFSNNKTRVIFASAQNPESIESATAKAAWIDEIGQMQFRRDTWEAVLRRLSISQGRVLGTTTPYGSGWFKTDIYDKWMKGDPNIDIIQVDSIVNPAFPKAEYERARETMSSWKFDLFYRGIFSHPVGLIYDAFDSATGIVKRFSIPDTWPRYVGMDFGQHSTACIFLAVEPTTGALYAYREYLAGGKSAAEHAIDLREVSKGEPIRQVTGGSAGEDGWRDAFTMAGWHVRKPYVKDVEVGIDKTYAFMKTNKFFVFSDLERTLKEITTYSRITDNDNTLTDKIQDKERYHMMDALRYVCGELNATNVDVGDKIKVRSYLGVR